MVLNLQDSQEESVYSLSRYILCTWTLTGAATENRTDEDSSLLEFIFRMEAEESEETKKEPTHELTNKPINYTQRAVINKNEAGTL